jgi:hypothetical protein
MEFIVSMVVYPGLVCRKKNFAPLEKFLYLDVYENYCL